MKQISLSALSPVPGSQKRRKRVGRGNGSGSGTTSGRGTKGQHSRSGAGKGPGFEGGQTPLYRRVPKLKGFVPPDRKEVVEVNVGQLGKFEKGQEISPEMLLQLKGREPGRNVVVKVLSSGELLHALVVRAHAFSKKAAEKIQAAGGKAETI